MTVTSAQIESRKDASQGCPRERCGGRLRVIASIEDPELIERILTHRATSMTPASLPFAARAPPRLL